MSETAAGAGPSENSYDLVKQDWLANIAAITNWLFLQLWPVGPTEIGQPTFGGQRDTLPRTSGTSAPYSNPTVFQQRGGLGRAGWGRVPTARGRPFAVLRETTGRSRGQPDDRNSRARG